MNLKVISIIFSLMLAGCQTSVVDKETSTALQDDEAAIYMKLVTNSSVCTLDFINPENNFSLFSVTLDGPEAKLVKMVGKAKKVRLARIGCKTFMDDAYGHGKKMHFPDDQYVFTIRSGEINYLGDLHIEWNEIGINDYLSLNYSDAEIYINSIRQQ